MDDWPELDALIEELRQANEEWWRRAEDLRQQLSGLQPHVEIISRQFSDLQVDAHLRALNDRALAGLGSVEIVHAGTGIEYVAALVWPAHVPPEADEAAPVEEGLYRLEVWMGPNLQDGRALIRISGAKRLEAALPTSPERFRSALLAVFKNPQYISRTAEGEEPREDGEPAPDAPPSDQASPTSSEASPPKEPPDEPPAPRSGA